MEQGNTQIGAVNYFTAIQKCLQAPRILSPCHVRFKDFYVKMNSRY